MREVNNNTANPGNVNFQGVQQRKDSNLQPSELPFIETSEVTDLGKMPAEVIGRSQVSKTAHQKDVGFCIEHPDKVEDLERYFNYLIKKQGLSYEDACAVIGCAAEEFYGA